MFRLLLSLLALMTGLAVPGVAVAQSCNPAAAEVGGSQLGHEDAAETLAAEVGVSVPVSRDSAAPAAAARTPRFAVIGNLPARAGFIVRVDRAHE